MTNIKLERGALVVLVGAMGCGKSTFCEKHFTRHDIVETDFIREQLTGDFGDQSQNRATFEIFFATVEARVKAGLLTVADSTGTGSVLEKCRALADTYGRQLIAIKFPHLKPSQITPERMEHRMKCLDAYHSQVARIDRTAIPKQYTLYELDDTDVVDISYYQSSYRIEASFTYVVVPDLHGEHHVLENYIDKYGDDQDTKFLFLGDVVDRGASSYRTYCLVHSLITDGKGVGVISNHDNKLYRYFKKWVNNKLYGYQDDIPTFGMTLAHGLSGTLKEFYSFEPAKMERYAKGFMNYYENLNPYLVLEKDGILNFFAHAGINNSIAKEQPIRDGDIATLMYTAQTDGDMTDQFAHHNGKVTVHVGHTAVEFMTTTTSMCDIGDRVLIRHDIGLGKEVIDHIPEFLVL